MSQGHKIFLKFINCLVLALWFVGMGAGESAMGLEVQTRTKDAQEMSALIEKYEREGNSVADEDGAMEDVARDLMGDGESQSSSSSEEPFDDIDYGDVRSADESKRATEISDDEIRIEVEATERAAETAAWY